MKNPGETGPAESDGVEVEERWSLERAILLRYSLPIRQRKGHFAQLSKILGSIMDTRPKKQNRIDLSDSFCHKSLPG